MPRLKHSIDPETAMSEYLPLKDSTEHMGDTTRLSEILNGDGYLLLRQLVDPDRVLQVKRDVTAILHEHHIIEVGDTEDPMWSGGPHPTEEEYMRYYDKIVRLDSFKSLAESPEIVSLMEGVFGAPVRVCKQRLIRIMCPDPDAPDDIGVGAHQDGAKNLGYKANRFYTCRLPLMDIDEKLGGLAIARGVSFPGWPWLFSVAFSKEILTLQEGISSMWILPSSLLVSLGVRHRLNRNWRALPETM